MTAKASKNSEATYNAEGRTNLLLFDPDKLTLVTDEAHPLYDPRVHDPVDEAMVRSIMFKGVVEPIIAWRDPESGKTCVVDGRGRVKNAKEANKRLRAQGEAVKLVPAIIGRGKPEAVMGIMVVANEGRREPSPLGRAKMAQRLVEAGYTDDQTSALLHCSKTTLKNYLSIFECTSAVQKAIEKGEITPNYAYSLSKLEPKAQREKLDKLVKAAAGETNKRRRGRKMLDAEAGVKGTSSKMRSRRDVEVALEQAKRSAASDADSDRLIGAIARATLEWVLGLTDELPSTAPVHEDDSDAEAPEAVSLDVIGDVVQAAAPLE
jgi:ParB family transcriptional regulator, chromosome partitioning protein